MNKKILIKDKYLNNFKKDIYKILSKYLFELNNQKTRKNISNDITNLINDKYIDLMNCNWKITINE